MPMEERSVAKERLIYSNQLGEIEVLGLEFLVRGLDGVPQARVVRWF
jgi:hypothetical protein